MEQIKIASIEDIARECAGFAQDNSGDSEYAGQHGPTDMWEGWHDMTAQEDLDNTPPMPVEFVKLYFDALYDLGGDALLAEVATGILSTADDTNS